jgi:hypothetical protein
VVADVDDGQLPQVMDAAVIRATLERDTIPRCAGCRF